MLAVNERRGRRDLFAGMLRALRSLGPRRVESTHFQLGQYQECDEHLPPSLAAWIQRDFPELADHPAVAGAVPTSDATLQSCLLSPDILSQVLLHLPLEWRCGQPENGNPFVSIGALADALPVCRPWAAAAAPQGLRTSIALHNDKMLSIRNLLRRRASPEERQEGVREEEVRAQAVNSLVQQLKAEEATRIQAGESEAWAAKMRILARHAELQELMTIEMRNWENGDSIAIYHVQSLDRRPSLGGFRIGDRIVVGTGHRCHSAFEEVPCRMTGTVIAFSDPEMDGSSLYSISVLWDCLSVNRPRELGSRIFSREAAISSEHLHHLRVLDIGWRELESRGLTATHPALRITHSGLA